MSSANRTMAGRVCTCAVQIQMLISVYDQAVFYNDQVFSTFGIYDNNTSELLWSILARSHRVKSKQEVAGLNMGKELFGMSHQAATSLRKNEIDVEPSNTMILRRLERILFPNNPGSLVTPQFMAHEEKLMLTRLARAKKDATPEAKQKANLRRLKKKRGVTKSEGIGMDGGYDFEHQNLPQMIVDLSQEVNNEPEQIVQEKKVKQKKKKLQKQKKKCGYCFAIDYHDEKKCPLKRTEMEREKQASRKRSRK